MAIKGRHRQVGRYVKGRQAWAQGSESTILSPYNPILRHRGGQWKRHTYIHT